MVSIKVLKRLKDIKSSIDAINGFLLRQPKRFDVFCSDEMFKSAVLYHITIIGEAINYILRLKPDIAITSARKIVNTRNYIIHGYDSLDNEILWSIVINHIPKLEGEIIKLLDSPFCDK